MIKLEQLKFEYPETTLHFSLEIPKGQRVAIVGESGAGKSTLLNLIAGFELAKSGQLWLNGENHIRSTPSERPVSILFQDNNLFPHLTVEQNIGLALVSSLKLNATQKQKTAQIACQMGIETLLNRQAESLSGGQKQRVALARTLLREKPILLLDEPFSALDAARREELQQLVLSLCQQQQLTLLMVTHQLDESRALFERVIRIENGQVVSDSHF